MKVYNLLKKIENPCRPINIYGTYGTFLYKDVVNNVPWHIAKCEIKNNWDTKEETWIVIKTTI